MARLTGNTLRTVRFYEEAGILRPDRRSAGGHRLFSRRELERLQFISDLRTAGLSLDAIRGLLDLKDNATSARGAASSALAAIDEQIVSLESKLELFTRLKQELLQAKEMLISCKDCKNDTRFPDECDASEVVSGCPSLSTSMRVLWSLDQGTSSSQDD